MTLNLYRQVFIATCSRNIASNIKQLSQLLDHLQSLSTAIQLIIVESDSSDGTPELLKELAARYSFLRVISLGNLELTIPSRTERIAYCRNTYLSFIVSEMVDPDRSLVIVFDSDGILSGYFIKNFSNCINSSLSRLNGLNWISCSGVTSPFYYDIYALRAPYWSTNDCLASMHSLIDDCCYEKEFSYRLSIRMRQLCLTETTKLIPVQSAFNGLCMYPGFAIKDSRYSGLDPDGNNICEHVPFNLQITSLNEGCFHYIDPNFVIGDTPLTYSSNSCGKEMLWYAKNFLRNVNLGRRVRLYLKSKLYPLTPTS